MGQMMSQPLLISSIIQHADRYFGDNQIVSRRVEGDIHRYTYRDCHRRARQMANALENLGVKMGDRVATLAWNGYRHMELYYAISGSGAVMHTINPRLHPEQIAYIANHAGDQYPHHRPAGPGAGGQVRRSPALVQAGSDLRPRWPGHPALDPGAVGDRGALLSTSIFKASKKVVVKVLRFQSVT